MNYIILQIVFLVLYIETYPHILTSLNQTAAMPSHFSTFLLPQATPSRAVRGQVVIPLLLGDLSIAESDGDVLHAYVAEAC